MNKAEIIFKEELPDFEAYEGVSKTDTLRIMEEYGKHMWNAALDWAAENATTKFNPLISRKDFVVDRDSILKAKRI